MLFSSPFEGAFGLDLGDLTMKLVRLRKRTALRRGDYYTVEDLRVVTLPPGYIVNGEIMQPELVRKKLLHILGKEGGQFKPIKSPWVVADLPEPKSFLKLIDLDTPANAVMYEDVAFQAKKHLPFELEETYLDWQVINPDSSNKTSQILIGAVPKVTADAYTYLLESVGLQPLALEIEAVPIARAMITQAKTYEGEARAILDLGAVRSGLIIYDHNSIQISTSIPFSGGIVASALSQHLKIPFEDAEKLKMQTGALHNPKYPKYLKVVTELVDMLTDELQRNFDFYREHFTDANPITHITMCGGFSNFTNLDALISRKLKISAKTGNTWKNLGIASVSEEERVRGLTLVSALGLALRATQKPITDSTV